MQYYESKVYFESFERAQFIIIMSICSKEYTIERGDKRCDIMKEQISIKGIHCLY